MNNEAEDAMTVFIIIASLALSAGWIGYSCFNFWRDRVLAVVQPERGDDAPRNNEANENINLARMA